MYTCTPVYIYIYIHIYICIYIHMDLCIYIHMDLVLDVLSILYGICHISQWYLIQKKPTYRIYIACMHMGTAAFSVASVMYILVASDTKETYLTKKRPTSDTKETYIGRKKDLSNVCTWERGILRGICQVYFSGI